ncbi:MAG: patatin-like phospholipase family protein [Proteobacteria bacterium]|nr:patatin-like phospholipase family protein [Pseudomonadota bacterium]
MGSFTALAYGLYGEKLFDQYESRFLKRDVQGTLFGKWLNPINWPNLWQLNYSRSEMSQDYYDEILFNNATFADLEKNGGPRILVSATEASTGYRFTFNQDFFDLICSDLSQVKLSRAAVSSSAVPIIFNPVTFHNYGKQCGENIPAWAEEALKKTSTNSDLPSRTLQRLRELKVLSDSEERPYLHLADGGISDNLGARIILELLETLPVLQAERESKGAPPLRNIAFIIVNSLSYPKVNWGKSAVPPSEVGMAMRAMGTPIDQYSYETISLIEDIAKSINKSPQLQGKLNGQAGLPINVTPIVLSFMQVADEKERDYFNNLPTSFRLAEEEVDQLRKLGGVLLKGSTQYKNLIKQLQAK